MAYEIQFNEHNQMVCMKIAAGDIVEEMYLVTKVGNGYHVQNLKPDNTLWTFEATGYLINNPPSGSGKFAFPGIGGSLVGVSGIAHGVSTGGGVRVYEHHGNEDPCPVFMVTLWGSTHATLDCGNTYDDILIASRSVFVETGQIVDSSAPATPIIHYSGYFLLGGGFSESQTIPDPPDPSDPHTPYYPRDPSEPGYCRHETPFLTDRVHEYVYDVDRYAGDLYGRDNQVAMYYRLADGTPDRLAVTALPEIDSTLVEYIRIMVVDYDDLADGTRLPRGDRSIFGTPGLYFRDAFPDYNDPAFPDGRYVMELESGRFVLGPATGFSTHNVHAIVKTYQIPEIERVRASRDPAKYAAHIFMFDLKMVNSVCEFDTTVDPESDFLCAHHRFRFYIWGFSSMNQPCDISYVESHDIGPLSKAMRAYVQDNGIYLVDTPCSQEHYGEETRGESWDDSNTEHTLENAIYFARDGATIRFSGELMTDDNIPDVCNGLRLSTEYSLTIDALLPYKITGEQIVEDTDVENWKGVLVQNSELDFDVRAVHTSGTDPVALLTTIKGVSFQSGDTGVYSLSPCQIDRCSFDGFLYTAVYISGIYRTHTVEDDSTVVGGFDDSSAITHSVFKNCGRHRVCWTDEEELEYNGPISLYSFGGALHGGDGPVVDNCLFVNNNHIKNYGTFLNCTIIAPTGPRGEPGEDFPQTYLYPEKSEANSFYYLHAINCFVAGYPIRSDDISTASNSIILHMWSSPEPGDEETLEGKVSYAKYYDNFLAGWRHNEVYDKFGEDGAVTVSDFLYDNYHPKSTNPTYSVLNKGSNQYIDLWNITLDLAGNPRVNEDVVDVGCFEWVSCIGLRVDGYAGVYDGYPHPVISVFDTSTTEVLGDDLTSQATLYIVPDEIIIRDPEQVDDYLASMVPDEVYLPGTIPTITHAPNEIYETEYIWDQARQAVVTAPGGKFWAGTLRAYVTPRPLYVDNMTITRD